MAERTTYHVDAKWDADARVWVATSSDVAGLVIQGRTQDEVVKKLRLVIPSLTEVAIEPTAQIEIHFLRQRKSMTVPLAA